MRRLLSAQTRTMPMRKLNFQILVNIQRHWHWNLGTGFGLGGQIGIEKNELKSLGKLLKPQRATFLFFQTVELEYRVVFLFKLLQFRKVNAGSTHLTPAITGPNISEKNQKQSLEVFCKKGLSQKFRKIHSKTPVPEPLF